VNEELLVAGPESTTVPEHRLASVPDGGPLSDVQRVGRPRPGRWDDTVVVVRVYNEAPVVGGVISLRLTDAEYIACFDADGQHQLHDLLGMIERIREGYDVVLGSRFLEEGGPTQMSWLRRAILRSAAKLLRRRGGVELTDAHNGLRIVARHVAADVRLSYAGMAYASQLEEHLTRPEYRIVEHPVHILYTDYSRAKGQPLLNSVNILAELAAHRVTEWGRR
jgi:glycosyltransferase involved in cell wall biosynthesis